MIGVAPATRPSKHRRPLVVRQGEETVVVGSYLTTKPTPWALRAERRWKNKVARAARKRNRP